MEFRKAVRKQAKLRLGLCGVSGGGKTYSALTLASGLGGKIAMIDTENGSGDLYANDFEYDIVRLQAPYIPGRYVELIKKAEKAGYEILIIDSLSHAWNAEGGLLEQVDKAAQSSNSKNSYYAWRSVTPQHNALVEAILQSNMHVIVTMRSKADYVTSVIDGKSVPKKIGLAPIQREGMDYEFTTVFDLSVDGNVASASKDRTKMFKGRYFTIDKDTGLEFKAWLETGISQEEAEKEERENLISHHKILVQEANTLDALKTAFINAKNEIITKYKDDALLVDIVALKDQRKTALETTQGADNESQPVPH